MAKTNGNDPINMAQSHESAFDHERFAGLTKREYFAAMAMQGYLAGWAGMSSDARPESVASIAVAYSESLIEALNTEE